MKRLHRSLLQLATVALVLPCGRASADFRISHTTVGSTASFVMRSEPKNGSGNAADVDFRVNGAGGPDHAHRTWWWYRLANEAKESAVNAGGVAPTWTLNSTGTAAYADFSLAPGINARMRYQVFSFGVGDGRVITSLMVRNTTNQPITLSLFHFLDLDVGGTAPGDSAVPAATPDLARNMRIDDPVQKWTANYAATNFGPNLLFVFYQVAVAPRIHNLLTNGVLNDFANSGLPFNAGDWTGGYQWKDVKIPAGKGAHVVALFDAAPLP